MENSLLQSDNQLFPGRVVIPSDDDILGGAGPTVCVHPGNIRFRNTILAHSDVYAAAKTRRDKTQVVNTVFRLLADPTSATNVTGRPPRYLRKDSIFDIWYIAPKQRKVARDKITQSLRDIQVKKQRNEGVVIAIDMKQNSFDQVVEYKPDTVSDRSCASHEDEEHIGDDETLLQEILPLLRRETV